MAHSPEEVKRYVCEHCQTIHAGTPVHLGAGQHDFEPPESCGACGESSFVAIRDWIHHHE